MGKKSRLGKPCYLCERNGKGYRNETQTCKKCGKHFCIDCAIYGDLETCPDCVKK